MISTCVEYVELPERYAFIPITQNVLIFAGTSVVIQKNYTDLLTPESGLLKATRMKVDKMFEDIESFCSQEIVSNAISNMMRHLICNFEYGVIQHGRHFPFGAVAYLIINECVWGQFSNSRTEDV